MHLREECAIITVAFAAMPRRRVNQKGVNKSGNVIETGSTKKDIRVEVCSKCHPFFTGKQKLVDTGGRVAKFNKRFGLDK